MQTKIIFTRRQLSFLLTLLFAVLSISRAQIEECGHEELNKCSLQVNRATELSFAPKREELAELCPDLESGLKCIRSYTRRCMTLPKRQQFMKLYKGTEEVIRDLCREGEFQTEFLKHAACLQTVKPQHQQCAVVYQQTMSLVNMPKANHSSSSSHHHHHREHNNNNHHHHPQQEQQQQEEENDDVKKVCCSFREYLDCSEHVTRRTCGQETGTFIRGFLKKMSSSLERDYCDIYYREGVNQCPNIFSSAVSIGGLSKATLLVLLALLLLNNNLWR